MHSNLVGRSISTLNKEIFFALKLLESISCDHIFCITVPCTKKKKKNSLQNSVSTFGFQLRAQSSEWTDFFVLVYSIAITLFSYSPTKHHGFNFFSEFVHMFDTRIMCLVIICDSNSLIFLWVFEHCSELEFLPLLVSSRWHQCLIKLCEPFLVGVVLYFI